MDNFDLVNEEGLLGGFKIVKSSIEDILKLKIPKSKINCEPHLSKYKLYNPINFKDQKNHSMDLLNFLQYSDGKKTIEEISQIINLNYRECEKISSVLKKNKLILI